MLIPIQRTTTYPSGVHRFVAYDTSNNTLEALSSSQPIEILKITNERVFASNITIYGNLEFGEAPSILRQRLQVNPLRKTFYVSNESCNEFFLSTNGIFGGESSNATVFLNQMLLMNYSPEYHDYSVSYTHQIIEPNTEYKITLTIPAAFGDFVDITVFPQLIQESSPQAGNVYQQVQLSYFRPYVDGIAYTDGNVGIGTSNLSLAKLTVAGDIFPSSNLAYDLGSSNHNWRDLYLSGNIKFNNTSLKNNIQVSPVRQVFNVQTDTQSLFTVSMEGIYGGEASNVNVFIGQHLLNYYNSNIKDYDLTILRNVDPPITNYTISLTQPAVLGNYVDITVFPQLLPESTPQGFVYQNVVLDADSFTTFAKNGNQIYYNNGNVGIGTSTPTQKLHVEGNALIRENAYIGKNTSYVNNLIPSASGEINGVNIGALNKRTRTSYASAINTVSTWTTRTSSSNNSWQSVCWAPELSLFCAVSITGTGDRVMTSSDGITWTSRASAVNNDWNSVCWSPELSLFCAVSSSGTGDRVMTSTNGVIWTAGSSILNNGWQSVCWASELSIFVAVGINSGTGYCIMTSSDGITWTPQTFTVYNSWRSVCWAPELSLFVAVSDDGDNRVMISADGITWSIQSAAINNLWKSVCWSGELSLFVAVSTTGTTQRVMTSPDGITWTARTTPVDNSWWNVCWAPELSIFVAVGANAGTANRIMTSPDGIVWTSKTQPVNNFWRSVCWSPELSIFAAVSQTGTNDLVMTSAIGMPNSQSVVKALPTQMMVNALGNVGIGTVIPTQKLHIEGNIFAKGNVTCSNINVIGDFVTLNTITSNTEQMVIENAGTGPALKVTQTGNNSVAEFYDKESGLAMIVANNGNVGIGTNAPSSALHVVGTATANALTLGTSTLSTPSGSMPMYACRAWVHFDGTQASGYKAAGNVNTVTRGTTGVYTITFITAMPSTNYTCIVTFDGGSTSAVTSQPLITKNTSNVIISCFRAESGSSTIRLAYNSTDVNVAIFS